MILAGLAGLIPLAVLGGLIWLAVRLVSGGERQHDPAVVVRQLAVYGLLAITAFVFVGGVSSLESELVSPRFDNTGLAQALSWLLIATPAFAVQAALADRRLAADPTESDSVAWAGYLNVMLGASLIGALVSTVPWLAAAVDPDQAVDRTDAVMGVTWIGVLVIHTWWAARRGIRGDVHLAFGSIAAAWTLGAGNVGLGYVLADRVYTALTDDPITERSGPSTATLAALFAVGLCAWLWYWLGRYEHAPRSTTWWVTVLPAGALVGAVAAVGATAYVCYLVLTWLVGDPTDAAAVRHFDDLPFALALAGTGAASWAYHRLFVADRSVRNEPVRAYDYVMLAASAVGLAVGLVLLIAGILSLGDAATNRVLAGVTLVLVSGPIWYAFYRRSIAEAQRDPDVELRSPLRRSYLYGAVAVAALTLLISAMIALQGVLLDVLDAAVGRETLTDHAEALATVIIATAAVGFHVRSIADDRRTLEAIDAVVPTPPPPDGPRPPVDLRASLDRHTELVTTSHPEGHTQ